MAQQIDPQSEQLLKEALDALKQGDKALARGKLETAVKIDQYNEKAWFHLATIVDTDEERRTCLGNVVIINPQNERAQKMLEKLEGRAAAKQESASRGTSDAGGGGSRKRLMMIGGVLVGLLLVFLLLMLLMGGGGDAETVIPTLAPSSTPIPPEVITETAQAAAMALITPTETPIPPTDTPSLPPTWTPVPAATSTPVPELFPAPPSDLTGQIIMQRGSRAVDRENQPAFVVFPGEPESLFQVSYENQRGQNPVLDPNANRFAWAMYSSGTRNYILQVQDFNASFGSNTADLYAPAVNLADPNDPAWYGDFIAFTGQLFTAPTIDLWLLNVSSIDTSAVPPPLGADPTIPPTIIPTVESEAVEGETVEGGEVDIPVDSPLTRLTTDIGNVFTPAFDPTGTALVFAVEVESGVTDLRVINIASQQVYTLTDNRNALNETAPDWGVYNEVNEIIFSASRGGGTSSDIYIMPADASAEPEVLIDLGQHDIDPQFSPDGRYIAFSTDYYGSWDVMIYDREADTFYTLAADPDVIELIGDWTP